MTVGMIAERAMAPAATDRAQALERAIPAAGEDRARCARTAPCSRRPSGCGGGPVPRLPPVGAWLQRVQRVGEANPG